LVFLLLGCGPTSFLQQSRKLHAAAGLALAVIALGAVWTGLMEKQKFMDCDDTSTNYCAVKTWANVLALWIGLFAFVFFSPWFVKSSMERGSVYDPSERGSV
jgi:hypothetical protein